MENDSYSDRDTCVAITLGIRLLMSDSPDAGASPAPGGSPISSTVLPLPLVTLHLPPPVKLHKRDQVLLPVLKMKPIDITGMAKITKTANTAKFTLNTIVTVISESTSESSKGHEDPKDAETAKYCEVREDYENCEDAEVHEDCEAREDYENHEHCEVHVDGEVREDCEVLEDLDAREDCEAREDYEGCENHDIRKEHEGPLGFPLDVRVCTEDTNDLPDNERPAIASSNSRGRLQRRLRQRWRSSYQRLPQQQG
ncbi:hypothetical protein DVH05_028091 [Phytophthora capsici]|nr:hypothetical protein DVH05_028091 [Phytophthora capsici]